MGNMVLSASLASAAVEAALAAKIRAMEEKVVMLEENRSRTEMAVQVAQQRILELEACLNVLFRKLNL